MARTLSDVKSSNILRRSLTTEQGIRCRTTCSTRSCRRRPPRTPVRAVAAQRLQSAEGPAPMAVSAPHTRTGRGCCRAARQRRRTLPHCQGPSREEGPRPGRLYEVGILPPRSVGNLAWAIVRHRSAAAVPRCLCCLAAACAAAFTAACAAACYPVLAGAFRLCRL